MVQLTKKQYIYIFGGVLFLVAGAIIVRKVIKNKNKKKECERIGGTWDAKTKTCTPPPQKFKEVVAKVYDNLTFVTNSDKIKSISFPYLKEMATYLKSNPELFIKITGHTDNVGNDAYNLDLSKRRADSVKNFLVKEGVGEISISTEGKGETEPIADNNTAEGREKNRRVVFEVTKTIQENLI